MNFYLTSFTISDTMLSESWLEIMSIGNKIKKLREEHNMTQGDLAKLLELGNSTISMYENEVRYPDTFALKKIAEIFNVSTDYLLDLSDIKEPIQIAASMNKDADLSDMSEKDKQLVISIIKQLKEKN